MPLNRHTITRMEIIRKSLIITPFLVSLVAVSPDASAQVAFVSDRDSTLDIYIIDSVASKARRITDGGDAEYGLVWSRDGSGNRAFIASPGRDEIAVFGPGPVKLPDES